MFVGISVGSRGGLLPCPQSDDGSRCGALVAAGCGGIDLCDCGCNCAMGIGDGRELGGCPDPLYLEDASVSGRRGGSGDLGTSSWVVRRVSGRGNGGTLDKMLREGDVEACAVTEFSPVLVGAGVEDCCSVSASRGRSFRARRKRSALILSILPFPNTILSCRICNCSWSVQIAEIMVRTK